MSRIRYVGGKIIKTSGGDTTLESLNGKFVSHARLSNNWSGEKGIIEKDYVNNSIYVDKKYLISGNWSSRNIKFGDEAIFEVLTTAQVRDHSWVKITLYEKNKFFDTEMESQEVRVYKENVVAKFLIKEEYMRLEKERSLSFIVKLTICQKA